MNKETEAQAVGQVAPADLVVRVDEDQEEADPASPLPAALASLHPLPVAERNRNYLECANLFALLPARLVSL